jgi:hypothetical protein
VAESLGKMADEFVLFVRRLSHCYVLERRSLTAHKQYVMKRFYIFMLKAARGLHVIIPVVGNEESLMTCL